MRTLQSFIDASMLGDGGLRLRKSNREENPKYQFSQVETHTDYVTYIGNVLIDYGLTVRRYFISGKIKIRKSDGYVYNAHNSWRLETWNSPELLSSYYRWYGYGKKKIPADIKLDWYSLAHWIMDDGSLSRNSYQIYSMSFTEDEQYLLTNVLYRDLDISSTVIKHHGKHIINISTRCTENIVNNIYPFILPSFTYKLKALSKSRELLEYPEVDDQQPSVIVI